MSASGDPGVNYKWRFRLWGRKPHHNGTIDAAAEDLEIEQAKVREALEEAVAKTEAALQKVRRDVRR